jgi:hypothetical protein
MHKGGVAVKCQAKSFADAIITCTCTHLYVHVRSDTHLLVQEHIDALSISSLFQQSCSVSNIHCTPRYSPVGTAFYYQLLSRGLLLDYL